jgi:hypothetical protein
MGPYGLRVMFRAGAEPRAVARQLAEAGEQSNAHARPHATGSVTLVTECLLAARGNQRTPATGRRSGLTPSGHLPRGDIRPVPQVDQPDVEDQGRER